MTTTTIKPGAPAWADTMRIRRKGTPTRESSRRAIKAFALDATAHPNEAQLRQLLQMICVELTAMHDAGTEDAIDAMHSGLLGSASDGTWNTTYSHAARLRNHMERMVGLPTRGGTFRTDQAEADERRKAWEAGAPQRKKIADQQKHLRKVSSLTSATTVAG